ncbi:thioredoxin [Streptomyces sp. NPDC007896]|uniref:thioredoxin n=1 Tax=Streptomyces sp. NPDC007896 TaxID=3364784 RepID=UPI0036EA0B4A
MAKQVHQPREDAEFDFILGMSAVPVLAYFTGTWPKAIEPCRAMDLAVGDIADQYTDRLTAIRTDMTRCPSATKRYRITGSRQGARHVTTCTRPHWARRPRRVTRARSGQS